MIFSTFIIATVTAFNVGSLQQNDSSPCLAADGENICISLSLGELQCASNDYPFGTLIDVPGYGVCRVSDRMNKRYTGKHFIDIALPADQLQEAREWGKQRKEVRILGQD